MAIADNLACVRERMKQAALRCNRQPDEVRLVAVSKTVSAEVIRAALNAGAMILGENYIQEARKKIDLIGRQAEWHFIGHLQSNKVKFAVDLFSLIHSVDRMTLAEELNREAGKRNKILPVLIQVNISGEETKAGIDPAGTRQLVQQVALLPHLSVQGLMTMPPWFENPEEARPYFIALRKLRDELAGEKIPNVSLKELSMGMSGDFETAIEEGATLVRIGTAIFGERG
ncbi:MAG: YggS family pyridoxal phosphate-dependent enzyme [Proteobacteria bacterium]|nr:YggS family pyridoxal phosphate-dependent enzyme [Pseudomonadota bacterium]